MAIPKVCGIETEYGIVVRDVYTAGPNVIGVPCAMYITWRAWRSHERFRTPETVTEPLAS